MEPLAYSLTLRPALVIELARTRRTVMGPFSGWIELDRVLAGRDGMPATAWLAYGLQDVVQQRRMIDESSGDDSFRRRLGSQLDAMLGLCETISCRRQRLLQ